MFKRICTDMLKEDNYLEALAYFCEKLLPLGEEARYTRFEEMDEVLWKMVETKKADELPDASGQALRISTAIWAIID